MEYVGVDFEPGANVDIVVKPGQQLPFDDGSFDLVISTSCLEHDPCPMLSFREMCRVVKLGGFIYANAPTNGIYHAFITDNWRFYSDAAQSFAYMSGIKMCIEGEKSQTLCAHNVQVEETAHCLPLAGFPGNWIDWLAVWKRVETKQTSILTSAEVRKCEGPLIKAIHAAGCKTSALVP
jgi:SAM-dependent methyltransferase